MSGAPTFDLQSHSIRSDGVLAPAEVVARAAAAGVELLALSDHDTVAGLDEALAAGREHGVRVVPCAEISSIDGEIEDLHVLGYRIDHGHSGLLAALEEWRQDREGRADRMSAALQECGFAVDRTVIDARIAAGEPVGRPHLAQAAFGHPDNARRIAEEGLETFSDLLVAYLIPGKPAYRGRTKPTVQEAIDVIHAAGGLAVWAHPFWDVEDPAEVERSLERFAAAGLDGVEAFYVAHDEAQTHLCCDVAERLGLLTTGSADFHGPGHSHFSRFRAFSLFGREPNLGPIAQV